MLRFRIARFATLRRLLRDRRGNVMMIMGFSLLPLIFAVGMGIDYSRAMRTQTKLNASADAAALAAVTTPMMNQSTAAACALARNMFVAQAAGLEGLVLNTSDTSQLTITVVDTNGGTCTNPGVGAPGAAALGRTATVSYRGQSTNDFGSILGISTLTIKGTSVANAAVAPNIDFYLMLDTSPSMLLPATSGGLATMVANTQGQRDDSGYRGCAFACHQTATTPSQDNSIFCNPVAPNQPAPGNGPATISVKDCSTGAWTQTNDNRARIDNYQLARNLGIVLRTDLVNSAVQNLTNVATTTASTNHAVYRMGISDFDYMYRQIWPTAPIAGFNVDSNLGNVSIHVADAQVVTYCANNIRVCGVNDNDTSTNLTAAFAGALATMPLAPGNGSNNPGDTPKAILFIITDGMRDELSGGNRLLGPIPTSQCDAIKNRGIRIAVLYTEYLPASASDGWSITNVKTPYLSPTDNISPPLISCASPGLYYKVTTDSDISAALTALFQAAVATARLTQ